MTAPSFLSKPGQQSDADGGDAYARAGVDITARSELVARFKDIAERSRRPEVLGGIGFFSALFKLGAYREPVLAASTDSVGTKLRIAIIMDRYDTVGEDIVNHCVNDILTSGAEPLFFLDYIGSSRIAPAHKLALIEAMTRACQASGCSLIGGETADMPDIYTAGDFDLVGFIVGAAERDAIIDGSKIAEGDVLLALPSTGLHTNGYSLVRRVFGIGVGGNVEDDRRKLEAKYDELDRRTLGDALLAVHRAYWNDLQAVLPKLHGIAHITGGGLLENVPRVLPDGLAARFDRAWQVPGIFSLIQREGAISDDDMYRTFNMGLGIVLAVSPEDAGAVAHRLPDALRVGEITRSTDSRRVIIS